MTEVELEVQPKKNGEGDDVIMSLEEIMSELCRCRTWKYTGLVLSLVVILAADPILTYITAFTGLDPSRDTRNTSWWECTSDFCRSQVADNPTIQDMYPCDINSAVLTAEDIAWPNLTRTSFSVDFDLYCPEQAVKKTLLSSIYFAGALIGLLSGSIVNDYIGRKFSAQLGFIMTLLATLGGVFCNNYTLLLVVRFLTGIGFYWLKTSLYILSIELVSSKYRNLVNTCTVLARSVGYPVAVGVAYFITDWHMVFLGAVILTFVCNVETIFCIESPSFYIIKKDIASARRSLRSLASLTTSTLDVDTVTITDVSKVEERAANPLTQIREICSFPKFLLEVILMIIIWFFAAMFFYGFNFGWGSILNDPYIGYIMAMVGEALAAVIGAILTQYCGRRFSMLLMLVLVAVFYLVAMIPSSTESMWNPESVSSLFGLCFVTGAYNLAYLWTAELAPTSHRGMVVCLCSSAARAGAVVGPFIFNNFIKSTTDKGQFDANKAVVLSILAGFAVLCAAASFILPETARKEPPTTPTDVINRRKQHRYTLKRIH